MFFKIPIFLLRLHCLLLNVTLRNQCVDIICYVQQYCITAITAFILWK